MQETLMYQGFRASLKIIKVTNKNNKYINIAKGLLAGI
jgi:hypothetical protein